MRYLYTFILSSSFFFTFSTSAAINPDCEKLLQELQAKYEASQPLRRKIIKLSNNLEVLLIHNPTDVKSAASLSVGVGSLYDPIGREGSFHFLEHMIFGGSENFPKSGEFTKFIANSGGQRNGLTSWDHTTYPLVIPHEFFDEALRRFADMMIRPTITEEYRAKEIHNIHDEYENYRTADSRRGLAAYVREVCDGHALGRYFPGNKSSLSCLTTTEIREIFDYHYIASRMKLVLSGPQSLEELESLAVKHFSSMADRQGVGISFPPLKPNKTTDIPVMKIKSLSERSVGVMIRLPRFSEEVEENHIAKLIALALNSGTPNSLQELLKKEDLITSMSAGANVLQFTHLMSIDFAVTEKGKKHPELLVQYISSYLQFLADGGLNDDFVKDKQTIGSFNFTETPISIDFDTIIQLSGNALTTGFENILERKSVPLVANAAQARSLAKKYLDTQYWTVILADPEFDGNHEEPRFNVKYSMSSMSPEQVFKKVDKTFPALKKNPFFEPGVEILDVPSPLNPTVYQLRKDGSHKLSWLPTAQFKEGKAYVQVHLRSPEGTGAQHWAKNDLASRVLTQIVLPLVHEASEGQIEMNVSLKKDGLMIQILSKHGKVHAVIDELVATLSHFQFSESRFQIVKDDLLHNIRNLGKEGIYEHFRWIEESRFDYQSSIDEVVTAIESVTLNETLEHIKNILSSGQITSLVYGEAKEEDAKTWATQIADGLKLATHYVPVKEKLPDVKKGSLNATEHGREGQGNMVYIQSKFAPYKDWKAFTAARMFSRFLGNQFSADLRTEKQLGYAVQAGLTVEDDYLQFIFLVLTQKGTDEVTGIMEDWILNQALQKFAELSDERFEQIRQSHIFELNNFPKTIDEKSKVVAGWIDSDVHPDHVQERLEWAKKLTKQEVLDLLKPSFSADQRRWQTIKINGNK